MSAMQDQYGPEKGKQVFYASANKGTIKGGERYRKRKLARLSKAGHMGGASTTMMKG